MTGDVHLGAAVAQVASHPGHVVERRLFGSEHALKLLVLLDLFPDPLGVVMDVGLSLDDLLLIIQPTQQVQP